MVNIKIERVRGVDGKVVRTIQEVELGEVSPKTEKKVKKFKKSKGKESKLLKQKLLRRPATKIKGISAIKALQGLAASQQGNVVREVEVPEVVQNNRSLFFRQEFINERKEGLKFLS